nr:hypothetical protein [Tanacetum cinerariifolium]
MQKIVVAPARSLGVVVMRAVGRTMARMLGDSQASYK